MLPAVANPDPEHLASWVAHPVPHPKYEKSLTVAVALHNPDAFLLNGQKGKQHPEMQKLNNGCRHFSF
jgi:hypothetical protein